MKIMNGIPPEVETITYYHTRVLPPAYFMPILAKVVVYGRPKSSWNLSAPKSGAVTWQEALF